jgi:hypothetical protein
MTRTPGLGGDKMAGVKEISATKSDPRLSHHGLLTAVVYFSAVLIGALLSWDYRYVVDNDTISHLDMADAYFRGDWKMAVHTYWNPLYAWVLGLAVHGLTPLPQWEYPTVHFVVFAIFLFALGCFQFFLGELIRFHLGIEREHAVDTSQLVVSETVWRVLGYSIFLALLNLVWVRRREG